MLVDTEEVAEHYPCYTKICQYWEGLADDSTKSISKTLSTMLHSNSELNELTSISLIGLNKSISKLGKVCNISIFMFVKLYLIFVEIRILH